MSQMERDWLVGMQYLRPEFEGRRVWVTGAGGFLGRYVVRALRSLDAKVIAPTRDEVNLTEQVDIRSVLASEKPEFVIHLAAACGGIGANVENPGYFLYANGMMGLTLIEECRLAGVDRFTLISTTCAYPQDAAIPLREESLWDGRPTGATGPYGMAKRLLHEALQTYRTQYGFRGVTLIPANLYGPEDHFEADRSHVVSALIRRFVEATETKQEAVVNWGTGTPTREFLHVRDAARAILMATANHDDSDPVNIGTGVETSIAQLASEIAGVAGYEGEIVWDTERPDGQPRRSLNVSRARAFGFESEINLTDGLSETVAWYRAHQ